VIIWKRKGKAKRRNERKKETFRKGKMKEKKKPNSSLGFI